MKIHHLNCATLRPVGLAKGLEIGKRKLEFFKQYSKLLEAGLDFLDPLEEKLQIPCHCIALESKKEGIILLDTGLGLQDVENPKKRLTPLFLNFFGVPVLKYEETAYAQLKKKGLPPDEVSHIVLTHLDIDHAGGLADFPTAEVHLLEKELTAAQFPKTLNEKNRYTSVLWEHSPSWNTYSYKGKFWCGLDAIEIENIKEKLFFIPLAGHTIGHAGIAFEVQKKKYLFAGDAYLHHLQLENPPYTDYARQLYNAMMHVDKNKFEVSLEKLRMFKEFHPEVEIFCTHDREELCRLQNTQLSLQERMGQEKQPSLTL